LRFYLCFAASEGRYCLRIHKAAKRAFDELGLKKLSSVSSLQKECAALLSEKSKERQQKEK